MLRALPPTSAAIRVCTENCHAGNASSLRSPARPQSRRRWSPHFGPLELSVPRRPRLVDGPGWLLDCRHGQPGHPSNSSNRPVRPARISAGMRRIQPFCHHLQPHWCGKRAACRFVRRVPIFLSACPQAFHLPRLCSHGSDESPLILAVLRFNCPRLRRTGSPLSCARSRYMRTWNTPAS